MANEGKTVNKLTAMNTVKLYNWLTEAVTLEKGDTYDSVAVNAAAALGFEVKGSNVQKAMFDLNLRFPPAKPDVDGRIAILKRHLEYISGNLGIHLPAEWSDL